MMRKKDFHERDLRNFFRRDKDSLDLAKMCLRYLEHSALSDKELKASIIEEKLQEEEYKIEGSDYREREKEVGNLFSSVLDSLVRLNMIISDRAEGATLLNFNHNYIPQHDYYG